MNVPSELKYTRSDEWVRIETDTAGDSVAVIGITDYAQHELGEIVYIELPEVDANLTLGVPFGVVESVKAVGELSCPLDGVVLESNVALVDEPAIVNESPYERGWMIKVKVADDAALSQLLDAAAYTAHRS